MVKRHTPECIVVIKSTFDRLHDPAVLVGDVVDARARGPWPTVGEDMTIRMWVDQQLHTAGARSNRQSPLPYCTTVELVWLTRWPAPFSAATARPQSYCCASSGSRFTLPLELPFVNLRFLPTRVIPRLQHGLS
jgi:hypothetical protein